MTVPVIKELLLQHPQISVTMLSDPFMAPLFEGIDRLTFIGANTKKDYKGITGLFRLARMLNTTVPFTAVADLHNVLRTKIIRLFLHGAKAVIDKGREEKKELTRATAKQMRQLTPTVQRYADVFAKLQLPVRLPADDYAISHASLRDTQPVVGVAPFAKHAMKMYPLAKMKEVVQLLTSHGISVTLFGGKAEVPTLDEWARELNNVTSLAGRQSFAEDLKKIAALDCMLSMDSANMHLASLYQVPVVSIWGGTHPWLGFYGWQQSPENAVQTDLPCRPSSVFGNKPCPVHGEAGCMQEITPSMVVDRVLKVLGKKD